VISGLQVVACVVMGILGQGRSVSRVREWGMRWVWMERVVWLIKWKIIVLVGVLTHSGAAGRVCWEFPKFIQAVLTYSTMRNCSDVVRDMERVLAR
jgi:hypothetical protein